MDIKGFQLSLVRNMGLKRDASKGSFIETVIATTEDFYRSVLQNLRPWKPAPPKLKPKKEDPQESDIPIVIKAEVEEAHEDMEASAASETH